MGGRIRVVSGDGQRVRAFEKSAWFVIQALDEDSNPLENVQVDFILDAPTPNSITPEPSSIKGFDFSFDIRYGSSFTSRAFSARTGPDGMASCPPTTQILAGNYYVHVFANDKRYRIDDDGHQALFKLTVTER